MPADSMFNGYTSNGTSQPTVTRTVTKHVVPYNTHNELVDPDVLVTKKHEEWTTSKKVVNHKTKQVETRVQRQLVLEDGRVVADSGPQVTTKTKEDVRVEESENSEHKTTGDDPPGPGYTLLPGAAQVISEKTESKKTMTETKEENRQMHDERIQDLSGEELHQRIIVAPDETDFGDGFCNFPGKLTHFSSRSQKIVDQEDVKEVSQIKDGEKSTETTRTHHHEEAYDDEVPEEEAEEGMVPERSAETSRKVQYYTDPKEFESVSEQLRDEARRSHARLHKPYTNGHDDYRMPAVTNWVDDHFRKTSLDDDLRETTRTTAGGNRITIEMTGNRSSPSNMSPTDSLRKNMSSRESTLRNRSTYDKNDWRKQQSPIVRSPSPPYPSSTLSRGHQRMTSSPFEVSSSSGSSRSKTPVKTFYLGEENTYNTSDRRNKTNKRLAELLKSNLSASESNVYSRTSNLSNHSNSNRDRHHNQQYQHYYNDSYRSPSDYRSPNGTFTRNGTGKNAPVYSNVRKTTSSKNTSKNIQVSMSDDEDDYDRFRTTRSYKERASSPPARLERSATTLPRNLRSNEYSKSLLIPITTSSSKHYKSTESLLSPNYSSYSSTFDYGSTNSFKYSDRRSPVYNRSGSAASTLRNPRNESYHNSSYHDDTYSTNRSNRSGKEYKYHKTDSYNRNGYEYANGGGRRSDMSKPSWHHGRSKGGMTSPPESGYQSPYPPSPPTSPPPRLVKVLSTDNHYGSSSSVSPPDSPHHLSSSSIRRSAAFPSGSTSRSKSSGDLRSASKLLLSPTSFSPLSSPTELKTMGEANDRQTFYRVKPGNDGRSVVVQVRDWQAR